jgi:hypothetical protein
MALKAGTIQDYGNSMAEAMEEAFLEEWPRIMSDNQPKPKPNDQMKLLFIAMAQGVVRHLADHPESFGVSISSNAGHSHSASVTVQTTGLLY